MFPVSLPVVGGHDSGVFGVGSIAMYGIRLYMCGRSDGLMDEGWVIECMVSCWIVHVW